MKLFGRDKIKGKTYSCLENTLVVPIGLCGLVHLILRCIRVHNAILSRNLFSVTLLVVALNALVLVELRLEKCLERLQLGLLGGARRICCLEEITFQALDAVLDGGVTDLRLCHIVLKLLGGLGVSSAESALMQLANEVNLRGQRLDVVAKVSHAAEEVCLRQRLSRLLLTVSIASLSLALVVVVLHLVIVVRAFAGVGGIWVELPSAFALASSLLVRKSAAVARLYKDSWFTYLAITTDILPCLLRRAL